MNIALKTSLYPIFILINVVLVAVSLSKFKGEINLGQCLAAKAVTNQKLCPANINGLPPQNLSIYYKLKAWSSVWLICCGPETGAVLAAEAGPEDTHRGAVGSQSEAVLLNISIPLNHASL